MGQRIRLLFTIPNFHTAGSGKVVYDLVKGLDGSKFEIEIACKHDKGVFFKEVAALGHPIHLFDTTTAYRPYSSILQRVWTIAKFYKAQRYDIIHSWQWSGDWTEGLAARLAGCQYLYTKKAMGFDTIHWKLKSFLARYIITVNDDMKQYFPNKKAQRLIPFGVDTDYFTKDDFTKTIATDVSGFHIVMVANLVPVKGLEVLLHAVNLLEDAQIRLTIVGNKDNDYGHDMQQLTTALELDTQVDFLGRVADVRLYIAKADLYVITTLNKGEGMPLALVEAMSMGIPILGSDITGINFVLKEFPELLFPAGDSKALATKIESIKSLSESQRNDIATNLMQYCRKHFSMKAFICAHQELYGQLYKNKS